MVIQYILHEKHQTNIKKLTTQKTAQGKGYHCTLKATQPNIKAGTVSESVYHSFIRYISENAKSNKTKKRRREK